MICGPRSKDSPNQSYYSGKRKEANTKHIGKEGLTGLGNLDRNQMNNLALSDQGPNSKKDEETTGQRIALLPIPSSRPGRT